MASIIEALRGLRTRKQQASPDPTSQPPLAISDESLSKLLANPISSYFSDAYNTLISVVQGLALGGLFVVLADPVYRTSSIFWPRFFLAFLIINTIWHRYISETQYVAWRLTPVDTLIPMSFAILQGIAILAIRSDPWAFALGFAAILLWGAVAYQNGLKHYSTPIVRDIYAAHYDGMLGDGFGGRILDAIIRFQQISRNLLATAFAGSLITVLVAYRFDKRSLFVNWLILGYSVPFAAYFFFFDLSRHLNRTGNIRLGREGVRW